MREYIEEVWEESRYTKPLDITRRIANDETITAARRVKSSEMKPFRRFIHFLVMKNDHELPYGDWLTLVFEAFGVPLVVKKGEEPKRYDYFEETFLTMCKLTRENGIWWIGSGENRRRDDDVNAPGGRSEKRKKKGIRMTLVGKSVIDEATIEGESGSDDRFYDAQVEVEEPVTKLSDSRDPSFISGSAEGTRHCGVDPRAPLRTSGS
ncbi:hypothetical protein Dimus_015776 [Dionaea muscipula]